MDWKREKDLGLYFNGSKKRTWTHETPVHKDVYSLAPGHWSHLGGESSMPWPAWQDSSSLTELRLGPSGLGLICL